jgi:Zn ribbon nucleic-acid-binding protein
MAKPKKRGTNDHKQPCACGKEIGFVGVWRDEDGVDHVECDACRGPPKMPYWRGTQVEADKGGADDSLADGQDLPEPEHTAGA